MKDLSHLRRVYELLSDFIDAQTLVRINHPRKILRTFVGSFAVCAAQDDSVGYRKIMMNDEFKTLQKFESGNGRDAHFHSLPALEQQGIGRISRLPISIRIVLESVLRNCDGKKVRRKDVETLANWNARRPANEEIPFVVARIVLQDFTGVPLVVDLAAMRSAVKRLGGDPKIIEPLVPVDLVVDHSVQVDFAGSALALQLNMDMEFKRNRERYEFLKWGQQAFKTFGLVPPGIGIVHR